jgi:hypothetical protein
MAVAVPIKIDPAPAISWMLRIFALDPVLAAAGAVGPVGQSCACRQGKNRLEIATSAFCLAEVCKSPDLRLGSPDRIADFFESDYILIATVDTVVGHRARKLMTGGHAGLRPPDAVHVATP